MLLEICAGMMYNPPPPSGCACPKAAGVSLIELSRPTITTRIATSRAAFAHRA
jgi:hypothetical protein